MALSGDMRRLTQQLLETYDDRRAEVIGIRSGTVQELAEFHTARQDMAAEQHQRLGDYMGELRGNVGQLLRDAATFVVELDAAHQAMAAEQRQHLGDDRAHLASDTAALLQEMDAAHQSMAVEQRGQLSEYMDGLHQDVEALRRDAATVVDELDAAHQAMAGVQRKRLADGRARRAPDTAAAGDRAGPVPDGSAPVWSACTCAPFERWKRATGSSGRPSSAFSDTR